MTRKAFADPTPYINYKCTTKSIIPKSSTAIKCTTKVALL